MTIALVVDVLQSVNNLDGDGVGGFGRELLLARLEDLLEVFAETLHDEEPVAITLEHVTAGSAMHRHPKRSQTLLFLEFRH